MAAHPFVRCGLPKPRRSKAPRIAGLFLLLSAAAALLYVLSPVFSGIGGLFDNSEQRAQIEALLAPAVMVDPAPFSDVSQANPIQLTEIALRSALLSSYESASSPLTDDSGRIIVSFDLVRQKGAALFGDGVTLTPATIQSGSTTFEYVEAENCYHVPHVAQTGYFIPKVTRVTSKNGVVTAEVACISTAAGGYQRDSEGNTIPPAAQKTVKYTLAAQGGSYRITGLAAA